MIMEVDQLVQYLDHPKEAGKWLRSLGVENTDRAHGNLVGMTKTGVTIDLLAVICAQLAKHLPQISDADMALNNLERFVAAARNPLSLGALFERDRSAMPAMLQIFSTSQHMSDLIIRDPESYDLLRLTEGQPVARDVLVEEICSEVSQLTNRDIVMKVLRRYKHRETLRIAYGDIVGHQQLSVITRQISFLADAVCEAALHAARRKVEEKWGVPRRPDGNPASFVVLALGKLGGTELNYSSDIDLVFFYDQDGKTDGARVTSNREYFERLCREFVALLTDNTDLGIAYRVDLRLRPDGKQGAIVNSLEAAMRYYDLKGRTWERQAYVKARPIAGDLRLGKKFLQDLQPWIYGRYLARADISGIKALKRRIERQTKHEGHDTRNVKTGHGGIRDIEFVIQFLQLLNGGDLPEIRTGNTLDAIARLESVGCLTFQERTLLEENYAFLRKIEHRLQIMFDLQTHTLPESDDELRKLAIRMDYSGTPHQSALDQFKADLKQKTSVNRKILDHLLHDAFGDEGNTDPEIDLVLDPNPSDEFINDVLSKHRFKDNSSAYLHLMELTTERISFLSTRRCRHFLASISPRLLNKISQTPDPDSTLVNLCRVSDSLGGKGVLWELFSTNSASLDLYVRLCASSPYLSGILTSNPGMIDELLDSLMLDKLPSQEWLRATLAELCRGAEDVDPMLHSFKNSQHMRVGIRDILGKEDIQRTHAALSDIAEVCLQQITQIEFKRLVERFGEPIIHGGARDGAPCELIILAMGKLGGREPNYHSDLDIVFLYEDDGSTKHRRPEKSTTNQHFFSQLGQRIIKVVTHLGPYGRLYELDPRLRPTGKSGILAVSLDELSKYFTDGRGQLWERQALCKARPIYGSPDVRQQAMDVVRAAILNPPWQRGNADEIRQMRYRLQETASAANLKRGIGGTVDIEFAVQMLQLKFAAKSPTVLVPGTVDAINALRECGHLGDEDSEYLTESYRFLRSIEARLRLMNTTARHDVPGDEAELSKLAFLLEYAGPNEVREKAEDYMAENRRRFERLFDAASG